MQIFLVSNYMAEARVLLQDTVAPYRYTDDTLLTSLNAAMGEISRIRPDILTTARYEGRLTIPLNLSDMTVTAFTTNNIAAPVGIPPQYKMPVLWYMTGMCQIIDTEDTADARAASFMKMFDSAMNAPVRG